MGGLNAAVLGLGVGKDHISAFRKAGAEVVAVCDTDEALLSEVGDRHGVDGRYTDYNDVAARDDVHVVSICTPDHIHADPAVVMMESGKHVLVEKPLATSFDDLERIVSAARSNNVKVTHGCQIRFGAPFQEVKRQVSAGEFGDLFYAEADYISNHINLFERGWRGRLGPDYNATAGGAIHAIDVIQWIIDSPPVEVTAYGNNTATAAHGLNVTDCVVCIIKFENGCVAKAFTTMGSARPGFRNVQIYGTKKTFVTATQPTPFLVSDLESRRWTPMEVGEEGDSRVALVTDLLRAIDEGDEPQLGLEQAVRTAGICVAAFDSIKAGKSVKIPRFPATPRE